MGSEMELSSSSYEDFNFFEPAVDESSEIKRDNGNVSTRGKRDGDALQPSDLEPGSGCVNGDNSAITSRKGKDAAIRKFSDEHWKGKEPRSLPENVIKKVWNEFLVGTDFDQRSIALLEFSQYLENCLWPSFEFHDEARVSYEHALSIVIMTNEKFRTSNRNHWDHLTKDPKKFAALVTIILSLVTKSPVTNSDILHRRFIQKFLIRMYENMDNRVVRLEAIRLVRIGIWSHLSSEYREKLFFKWPELREVWDGNIERINKLEKDIDNNSTSRPKKTSISKGSSKKSTSKKACQREDCLGLSNIKFFRVNLEKNFLLDYLKVAFSILAEIPEDGPPPEHAMFFCEEFVELLIDLISNLLTRRYLCPFLKYFHVLTILKKSHAYAHSIKQSQNYSSIFANLCERFEKYLYFPINEITGEPISDEEAEVEVYENIKILQRLAFSKFNEKLNEFALSSISYVYDQESLEKYLRLLTQDELMSFCGEIGELKLESISGYPEITPELIVSSMASNYKYHKPQGEYVNNLILLPDGKSLYGNNTKMLMGNFMNNQAINVPKIGLQFLSLSDYLIRNFELFFMESSFTIAQDINDIIKTLSPRRTVNRETGNEMTVFARSSRMAFPVSSVDISAINTPRFWEFKFSAVYADIVLDLNNVPKVYQDFWKYLEPHNVLFLVVAEAEDFAPSDLENSDSWCHPAIKYVRGCRMVSYLNDNNQLIKDTNTINESNSQSGIKPCIFVGGNLRKIRVSLDTTKYSEDVANGLAPSSSDKEIGLEVNNIYKKVNIIIGRKPQENNFDSVHQTIRSIIQDPNASIPDWFYDTALGYGNHTLVTNKGMKDHYTSINFENIFMDLDHLKSSFNVQDVDFGYTSMKNNSENIDNQNSKKKSGKNDLANYLPPYIVTFPENMLYNTETGKDLQTPYSKVLFSKIVNSHKPKKERVLNLLSKNEPLLDLDVKAKDKICVHSYRGLDTNNINSSTPKGLRYTVAQVKGILSGILEGLTLIVGPPGTGKTDVAVKIICNLHNNFPDQRILLITHSNQALNQIFEKIHDQGVDPRFLLRLGHGNDNLDIGSDSAQGNVPTWGKYGRVNAILEERIRLLDQVTELCKCMDISGDYGSSCETAESFWKFKINPIWEKFISEIKDAVSEDRSDEEMNDILRKKFPFSNYFSTKTNKSGEKMDIEANKEENGANNHAESLFRSGVPFVDSLRHAKSCYLKLENIFEKLRQVRVFELLPRNQERSNYYLSNEAKVIAMTCTHAALRRDEFLRLGAKYDSIIMEEASQILEIESFIPLFLQVPNKETQKNHLKRIVMIGDHHQLPPIVRSKALKLYSNMEQSLFLRMIRLGVPSIQLDAQGRCRKSICDLFRWKYPGLSDLPVVSSPIMKKANPGFAFEFQAIDVPLKNGKGEYQIMLHYIQNYEEASYVVSVYAYMILLGYPSDKISLLATYNGQQELISQLLHQHKEYYETLGFDLPYPQRITTVDNYQGQQNDYILLSLTRTNVVGHLRDIRRLIVAVSRAKLGLYIFGFTNLFMQCIELQDVWSILSSRPMDGLFVWCREKYSDLNKSNFRSLETTGININNESSLKYSIDPKYKKKVYNITSAEHMKSYVSQMIEENLEYKKNLSGK